MDAVAVARGLETADLAARRLAPEEPEPLERQRLEDALRDEVEDLLEIERRGHGPGHLVQHRRLDLAGPLEQHPLVEDRAAMELEEGGAHERGRGAAEDGRDPVRER